MGELRNVPIGYSDGDIDTNGSSSATLGSLVAERYSRRQTMFGGVAALTTAVFSSTLLAGCDDDKPSESSLTVNAGESGRTSAGRVVTLRASTSFDVPEQRWEQVSGPAVALMNPNSGSATFLAPSVAAATPLVFRFTGTDFAGRSKSGETTITVDPADPSDPCSPLCAGATVRRLSAPGRDRS